MLEGFFSQKIITSTKTSSWKKYALSDISMRITRKNNGATEIPLTISSQHGLIDQRKFFSKIVASNDLSGYYLIKKGEFAYNRSTSSDSPFGAIKRLENYDFGAVSTLYLCFSVDESVVNGDLIKLFFESTQWHEHIRAICSEGARNHGLLNVPTNDFFDMELYLPCDFNEQNRIINILSSLDERYNKELKKLDCLMSMKQSLLSNMFI